jgi:uncharacterized Zn finger protein
VDNVGVNVTINPADGSDESYSDTVYVPGDREFVVGEDEEVDETTLTVTTLMVRDDAVGYDANKLARDGDRAVAKDIKRVYAEATGRDSAWSGW